MMTIYPMWAMTICCPTTRPHGILAISDVMLRLGPDFAQNYVNALLLFNPLSMVKRYRPCTTPCSFMAKSHVVRSNGSTHTSIGIQQSLSIVKATSPLHVLQSVTTECQCVYVVVQDPSLVIRACHECLGLLLRGDIEGLIVDALEGTFDHCISLLLCLKDTLVQIDVFHAYPLSIDRHIARNTLCCIVYHMLLTNQAIHLRSQSHELCDAMSVVLVIEDGSR